MKKDAYFTGGWNKDNLILLAEYNNFSIGAGIDTKLKEEDLKTSILENGNVGDTEAKKLYEDKNNLIFLSIDWAITVIVVINKNNLKNSQSIEI